jgi:hypothetical protein
MAEGQTLQWLKDLFPVYTNKSLTVQYKHHFLYNDNIKVIPYLQLKTVDVLSINSFALSYKIMTHEIGIRYKSLVFCVVYCISLFVILSAYPLAV